MAHKARIGDVIEISTSGGLTYAQYTHQVPKYAGLIRIFDAVYDIRPNDFKEVVEGSVRFSTLFHFTAAVSKGLFPVVASHPVTAQNQIFPVFRNGVPNQLTQKVETWWFWDGEKEWMVGSITAEQRKMPILGIWNGGLLKSKIEAGWTPITDHR